MKKRITASKVFDFFNVLFMLFVIFVTIYPVYYVVICSFSDPWALLRKADGFLWAPVKPFTLKAYEMILDNESVMRGFANTLFVLAFGLTLNILMTIIGGYFLSLKGLMLQDIVAFMIIFTMYFSGGLIPSYLNIKSLGLLNSLWSLIIPAALSTSNLIIMKAGFRSIPDSLIESAKLDGAGHIRILFSVMVPLAKATIAVITLYYGVGHWNSWFSASIYLQNSDLFPLQLVAHNILTLSENGAMIGDMDAIEMQEYANLIKYALIVVSTAPVLALYPFLQRYFVKGVMIGAIKG